LQSLGNCFSEEEVKFVINQLPGDKALGPDGFTGAFYKHGWGIVGEDEMRAINLLGNLHVSNFHWLNSQLCQHRAFAPKRWR
jgi:hypothetical protein